MGELGGMVESWGALAVAVTWQLAALAVVVWLCETLFRLRHARARHALWWVVLVGPLLLAPGRIMLVRRDAAVRVAAPEAVVRVAAMSPAPAAEFWPERYPGSSVPGEVFTSSEYQAAMRAHFRREAQWFLIFGLWLVGMVVLAARLLVGHRQARRMVRTSRRIDEGAAAETLRELCGQSGVRRGVELHVSPAVGAPVLYGFRFPAVVVPEGWIESLSPDEMRALLAHEVAHVKRGDVLANLLQHLVQIPLFFHPGAWLAGRRIALAREELADAWALRNGADAVSYARALSAAAERTQTRLNVASVGVAEGRSTLLRRMEAIMRGAAPGRLRWPAALALATLVVVTTGAVVTVKLAGAEPAAAEQETTSVRVINSDQPLSPRELESALSQAGVRAHRFVYEFDRPHHLHLTFGEYVSGALAGTGPSSSGCDTSSFQPGTHTVAIVTRRQDAELGFWFSAEGGGSGLSGFGIDPEAGWTEGIFAHESLRVGERVPIFFYAMDREHVGGVDGVAQMIAEYDRVIVVYGEILLDVESDNGFGDRKVPRAATAHPESSHRPSSTVQRRGENPIYDVIDLRHMDAVYIAWLFGKADLPRVDDVWMPGADAFAVAVEGKGALQDFLPEGIDGLAPVGGIFSKQLIVLGTPEAIADLREIMKMIDHKPQQVIIEVAKYPGLPAALDESKLSAPSSEEGDVICPPLPAEDARPPDGVEVDHFRVATMNLVPAANIVTTRMPGESESSHLLVVTPRINGDGTITLYMQVRQTIREHSEEPERTGEVLTSVHTVTSTVNVEDGQPLPLIVRTRDGYATLIITARAAATDS